MKKSEINLEDILTDRPTEEDLVEVPLGERAFKILFWLAVVLGTAIFLQSVNLAVLKGDFYKKRAANNMSQTIFKIAPRGIIKDRFNEPLVQNKAIINVYLNINSLPKETDKREEILKIFSRIVNQSYEELVKQIKNHDWQKLPRLLVINDLKTEDFIKLKTLNLPGFEFEEGMTRLYKKPFVYAHILGYNTLVDQNDLEQNSDLTPADIKGRSGLEAYYHNYLQGKNGRKVFFQNAKGLIQTESFQQEAKAGYDLETFIDGPLQEYIYERLQNGLNALGRQSGVGLVLNPQNGEVLALVNIPSFDGTAVADFLQKPNNPLFNRAISGLYNPGSTIKPLVAIAALKEKIISPEKKIYSAGYLEIPNPYNPNQPSRFLDWKPHGWVNMAEALARSSNIYFYEIGGGFGDQIGLGIEKLRKWWQKFNLDVKTGIDLPNENSGFLPTPAWKEKRTHQPWRLGDTYNVSIGQGDLLVTPLALLNYLTVFANGGKLYQPRIMKAIKKDDGETIIASQPVVIKDLSEEISEFLEPVRKGLEQAVNQPYGTAFLLNDLPIRVAAKTGTAQVQQNTKLNAFFIGYAPVENPTFALLILIENAREGGLNAVPIAKDIFLWYYKNRLQ